MGNYDINGDGSSTNIPHTDRNGKFNKIVPLNIYSALIP
jgi:hypothetical protein